MKEPIICSNCGAILTEDEVREFDGQILCAECLDSLTVECDCCHERTWREDAEIDNHIALCLSCYDHYYTTCESCGRLIPSDEACYEEDSDYAYCEDCYSRLDSKPIKSYNYKPEPIFYGSGDLFYGVELELDKGGYYDEYAGTLLDIANRSGERMYCKHDGSLRAGFEMVSHPMTLDYHLNKMNWRKIFDKAVDLGYRSHNTSTCGLHVHVNRLAFGSTYDEQEDTISRIVYFVEAHWNELLKFSRRTVQNMMHWASRYGIADTAKLTYDKAKKNRMGRYVAVNLSNMNTIEFRIFRGTLRYKTFVAALQLVDEICRLAITHDDGAFEGMSWSDFAAGISKKKPELIEYLKSKRLYVNEEAAESEEM